MLMAKLKNTHKRGGSPEKEIVGEIGERFQVFRNLLGRSPGELAVELGLPLSLLDRIEAGDMEVVFTYGGKFADRYNLNLNWALFGIQNIFMRD
jgi:hypothetical protein